MSLRILVLVLCFSVHATEVCQSFFLQKDSQVAEMRDYLSQLEESVKTHKVAVNTVFEKWQISDSTLASIRGRCQFNLAVFGTCALLGSTPTRVLAAVAAIYTLSTEARGYLSSSKESRQYAREVLGLTGIDPRIRPLQPELYVTSERSVSNWLRVESFGSMAEPKRALVVRRRGTISDMLERVIESEQIRVFVDPSFLRQWDLDPQMEGLMVSLRTSSQPGHLELEVRSITQVFQPDIPQILVDEPVSQGSR